MTIQSTELPESERLAVKPRRSPVLALILGIVPGLGEIYAGNRGRGLAMLLTIPSLILLILWRMSEGGIGYVGSAVNAPSDSQLRSVWLMSIFLFIIAAIIYLWSILDGMRATNGRPLRVRNVILLSTVALFVIGWDATQIDLYKAATRFPQVIPSLRDVGFPWSSALVRGVEQVQATVPITVPCNASAPDVPAQVQGEPYISVSPMCGDMSGSIQPDGTRNPPGTVLHVKGTGFRPNELVYAWWESPASDEFRLRQSGDFVTAQADASGAFNLDLPIPNYSVPDNGKAITNTLVMRQQQAAGPLHLTENLVLALDKMLETIFLGLMATLFGIVLALPLGFLAANNIMSTTWQTRIIYVVVRGVLNAVRAIDPLVWAVIAVVWVGLGPFAGVVALTLHTIASLGKLYSEAIESIDPGPLEAITATGANWLQVIVYGVIPQVIPPFLSFTIYRWDFNIRASTIIGAVGGGGIGFLLIQWVHLLDYVSVGFAVWLIGIVIAVLDYVSAQIRIRFV